MNHLIFSVSFPPSTALDPIFHEYNHIAIREGKFMAKEVGTRLQKIFPPKRAFSGVYFKKIAQDFLVVMDLTY